MDGWGLTAQHQDGLGNGGESGVGNPMEEVTEVEEPHEGKGSGAVHAPQDSDRVVEAESVELLAAAEAIFALSGESLGLSSQDPW